MRPPRAPDPARGPDDTAATGRPGRWPWSNQRGVVVGPCHADDRRARRFVGDGHGIPGRLHVRRQREHVDGVDPRRPAAGERHVAAVGRERHRAVPEDAALDARRLGEAAALAPVRGQQPDAVGLIGHRGRDRQPFAIRCPGEPAAEPGRRANRQRRNPPLRRLPERRQQQQVDVVVVASGPAQECDAPAVGGPCRRLVLGGVGRQPQGLARPDELHVDVRLRGWGSGPGPGEGDLAAVGREGRARLDAFVGSERDDAGPLDQAGSSLARRGRGGRTRPAPRQSAPHPGRPSASRREPAPAEWPRPRARQPVQAPRRAAVSQAVPGSRRPDVGREPVAVLGDGFDPGGPSAPSALRRVDTWNDRFALRRTCPARAPPSTPASTARGRRCGPTGAAARRSSAAGRPALQRQSPAAGRRPGGRGGIRISRQSRGT